MVNFLWGLTVNKFEYKIYLEIHIVQHTRVMCCSFPTYYSYYKL